jgi:3-hydroxyisobutyrate dehydrogenase-like beta-hydroxyacid dehydrogenase
MAGGKPAVFYACYDVMKAMAASVVRVGDLGAGSVAKLANQIIVAINIAAVSEALVLATKAGVAPEHVHGAIRGGLAGSAVLEAKGPLMLDRKFQPGFRLNLHIKDLANVVATSHGLAVPLPLTAAVMEMMQALKAAATGIATTAPSSPTTNRSPASKCDANLEARFGSQPRHLFAHQACGHGQLLLSLVTCGYRASCPPASAK